MRNHFVNFRKFVFGETKEIEIEERFVEVEETHDGILAIHGRNGFNTDIQEMRGAVTKNIFLHVTRLRSLGGGRNTSARTELAHKNTVAITLKIGNWMQDTVDTHANADRFTKILDMDIRGAELVGLIEKEVKNFIGTDGVKGLRDRS